MGLSYGEQDVSMSIENAGAGFLRFEGQRWRLRPAGNRRAPRPARWSDGGRPDTRGLAGDGHRPLASLPAARENSGRAVRVLIADDQRVVREGLATIVAGFADTEVVGLAADGAEAVELVSEHDP